MSNYPDEQSIWKIISSVQSDILELCENGYYKLAYMNEEKKYWPCIPSWMLDEKSNNRIKNILDIGCGYGTLSITAKLLYKCNVCCMDFINAYLSKKIIDKYNLNFKIGNIETDRIPWNFKFDIILLTEVIEHFNFNSLPTLIKIREALSDNGSLFLSTPDAEYYGRPDYYRNYKNMPAPKKGIPIRDCHIYVFNKRELLDIFDKTGFSISRLQKTESHHFNIKLVKK
ncbi:MAG TPA: hypothetical protein DD426_03650 [Clostridiaceae bacterium]|nr:hypothetical protein [Clostridiaceae bacterium]